MPFLFRVSIPYPEGVMSVFKKYRKTFVAVAGAVVLIVGRLAGVDSDAYFIVVTLATAFGVYATPNA